jgi:hypothetical protein
LQIDTMISSTSCASCSALPDAERCCRN